MSQAGVSAWSGSMTRFAAAVGMAALIAMSGSPARAAGAEQLSYKITHAMFGDIGTYSNTIEPHGDATTVVTRSHIRVKVLGMNVYHEDAQRTEEWRDGRLVSFRSDTRKGDGTMEVSGVARGNQFLISTSQGTVAAPATVHPANPWSANFIASSMMMRPDTGKLEPVSVSGGSAASVKLSDATIPARRYDVNGQTRYSVWLDGRGVPLKFVVDDDSGKVTFTLTSCSNCGVAVSEAGSNTLASQR
jgi:hypothetical protein